MPYSSASGSAPPARHRGPQTSTARVARAAAVAARPGHGRSGGGPRPPILWLAVVFAVQAGAAFSLPTAGAGRVGAVLAVVGFGIGFGVASLVKPSLLAVRYGTTAYGSMAGILATPITLAKAVAPLGAAGLLTAGGYLPVLAAIGGACVIAAVGIVARASSPTPVPTDQVTGAAVLDSSSATGTDSPYISKP